MLIGISLALFAVELLYYRIVYMRPCRRATLPGEQYEGQEQPPVSVIVYANNESGLLKENLPLMLNQDYPDYEVIVVNDGSTDESDEALTLFGHDYPHLYHTFVPQESKYLSRRKLSLTIGIKAARHDILLFTEARCRPLSNRWIADTVRHYSPHTDIVLGFCAYRTQKGFFHKLVACDNLLSGVRYLAPALAGHPYSGNGQNLSYRKGLFFEHKGYSRTLHLHAGHDDLFVNQAASGRNTRVAISPGSITEMAPYPCFAAWKEMKTMRAATQRYLKGHHRAFYLAETICSFLFLPATLATLAAGLLAGNPATSLAGILLYAILYTVKAIVWKKTAAALAQHPFTPWLPFLEVACLTCGFYLYVCRLFRNKRDYTFTFGGK